MTSRISVLMSLIILLAIWATFDASASGQSPTETPLQTPPPNCVLVGPGPTDFRCQAETGVRAGGPPKTDDSAEALSVASLLVLLGVGLTSSAMIRAGRSKR